jgi:hypothetical protein
VKEAESNRSLRTTIDIIADKECGTLGPACAGVKVK